MASLSASPKEGVRPLKADDLERAIAIDQAHTGRARRRFFEKRLEAAKRRPDDFIHVGVTRGGTLVGFVFARVLHGEFGREQAIASVDLLGVDPEYQERGYGRALMDGLGQVMRKKGVRLLHSQADWTNHGLVRFLDSAGFELASRLVLERPVNQPLIETTDEV